MASPSAPLGRDAFIPNGMFSTEALEANRAGRLTDVQRGQFGAIDRRWRSNMLFMAAGFAIIGLLVFSSNSPGPNAVLRPLAGLVCIAVAIAMFVFALPTSDALAGDVSRGAVASLDGAMEKHEVRTSSGRGAGITRYFLDVGNEHFECYRHEYEAAPSAAWVRVYYLPKSHKVVNLERLAAPASAAAMPTSMAEFASVLRTVGHSKGEAHHEAMAQLEALGETMKAMRVHDAVPPPPGHDVAPLDQAIVGTWNAGPVSFHFAADGSMEMRTFGGRVEKGHWSVDGQGLLHADAMGSEQAGQAWVEGDTLTVSRGDDGIKLRRVQDA